MSVALRSMRLASRQSLRSTTLRHSASRPLNKTPTKASASTTAGPTNPGGTSSPSGALNYSALTGGAIGGGAVLVLGYGWYHFSGAKAGVRTMKEAKSYVDSATSQLKGQAKQLKPDETLQWLRSTTSTYVGLIPGGKGMADKMFDGLEEVRAEHEGEVTEIVNEAYKDLQGLANKGSLDADTAMKAWSTLEKAARRLEKLVESVGQDVLEKNPELKEKYGEKLKQLKKMGNQGGDEAKKIYDESYQKITDAVKGGNVGSVGDIIQDGLNKAQGMGDDALKKAFEKAKPYLDKSPDLKKSLEENYDQLKQQGTGAFVKKLQEAVQSGDVQSLKGWVEQQTEQMKGMSDQAWKGAMIRASIYLDKYPELKKVVEEKSDALKKVDFEELMSQLRKAGDTGDIKPAKDFIEKEAERVKNA